MPNCIQNLHSRFQCLCPCCNLTAFKWGLGVLVVISILAVAAAPVLILRLAVIPKLHATVDDARLDTFQFSSSQGCGSSLSYNISVALAIHNKQGMGIRCTEPLVATFIFHDRRLANVTIAGTGKKYRKFRTELHRVNATGEVPSLLLGAAADDFKKQNPTGLFMVEMRLSGEITYQKVSYIATTKRTLSMSCLLRLQLAPPGPEIVVFHQVNCKSIEQDKIYF